MWSGHRDPVNCLRTIFALVPRPSTVRGPWGTGRKWMRNEECRSTRSPESRPYLEKASVKQFPNNWRSWRLLDIAKLPLAVFSIPPWCQLKVRTNQKMLGQSVMCDKLCKDDYSQRKSLPTLTWMIKANVIVILGKSVINKINGLKKEVFSLQLKHIGEIGIGQPASPPPKKKKELQGWSDSPVGDLACGWLQFNSSTPYCSLSLARSNPWPQKQE